MSFLTDLCIGSAVVARADLIPSTRRHCRQFQPVQRPNPYLLFRYLCRSGDSWVRTSLVINQLWLMIGDGLDHMAFDKRPVGFRRVGFTGLNNSTGTMTFDFNSGPVSHVELDPKICSGSGPNVVISALDITENVSSLMTCLLARSDDRPVPGQFNAGASAASRGRPPNLRLYVSNQSVALDDLTFSRQSAAPVPEPTAMLLLGSGVAGLAAAVRRRRKST